MVNPIDTETGVIAEFAGAADTLDEQRSTTSATPDFALYMETLLGKLVGIPIPSYSSNAAWPFKSVIIAKRPVYSEI